MGKKVLIATGGTGGHIYPAEALASELEKEGISVFFAGGLLSQNRFFDKKWPYKEISSGGSLRKGGSIVKGTFQSLSLLKKEKPDCVVGFGSFYSFPVLAAACLKKVPIVLFAADSHPGKVIRWFSPFAKSVALHFPNDKLEGEWVTMPVRFDPNLIQKEEACRYFKLDPNRPILLIFGGSQGATKLNHLASKAVLSLPFQIIHLTGNKEDAFKLTAFYEKFRIKAAVKPFENKMDFAWKAADLCLIRAGAVSIAESRLFKVPGLLVPFPFAMDDHQAQNGKHMVDMGLSEMRRENELTEDSLAHLLQEIYSSRFLRIEKAKKFQAQSQTLKDVILKNL